MAWLQSLDIRILTGIREVFQSPLLDRPMLFISALGDAGFIWILLGVLFLCIGAKNPRWRSRGVLLLLSLGTTALVCNLVLKPIVARVRPYDLLGYDLLLPPLSDFSFPSGHTAASFAAATAIFAMNKKWGIGAYLFAAGMGFSRLYLGVHFPSDVLAGGLIGFFMARLTILILKKISYSCKSDVFGLK